MLVHPLQVRMFGARQEPSIDLWGSGSGCTVQNNTGMYCTNLYWDVLYKSILGYIVQTYTGMYCTKLYCDLLYKPIPGFTVQIYTVMYCTKLYLYKTVHN